VKNLEKHGRVLDGLLFVGHGVHPQHKRPVHFTDSAKTKDAYRTFVGFDMSLVMAPMAVPAMFFLGRS